MKRIIRSLPLTMLLLFWATQCIGEDLSHTYATGKVMEIDRCASAWLIKRHVDRDAQFVFLGDEELMTSKATSFDTPFSNLRRTHRHSTFEAITNHYTIQNDRVAALAAFIHDLEINFWNKKRQNNTATFEIELKEIIRSSRTNQEALKGCFTYLDNFVPKNQQ